MAGSGSTEATSDQRRGLFTADHDTFRRTLAAFIAKEVLPHHARWEEEGLIPRDLWRRAGATGLLLPMAPDEYGGGGGDFRYSAIVVEAVCA